MRDKFIYNKEEPLFVTSSVQIQQMCSIHPQGCSAEGWLKTAEPDYKTLITNASLRRRMSRVVKMGVACGLACLKDVPAEQVDGVLTATGWGCLADTQKFMDALLDNQERLLNPTPFMQSTFNTIGAQIALCKGIHTYNMTYVQRGHSFENALLDAVLQISEGKETLLVGAFDEVTPISSQVLERLGLSVQLGEGAQFFLLRSSERNPRNHEEKSLGFFLKNIGLFSGKHGPSEIGSRAADFLSFCGLSTSDIDVFMDGRPFPALAVKTVPEAAATEKNDVYDCLARRFPRARMVTFKDACGEYPTAVSYALWKAGRMLQEQASSGPFNILIYNNFLGWEHTFLLVSNVCGGC